MSSHRIDRLRISIDVSSHIAEHSMEACSQLFHTRLRALLVAVMDDADCTDAHRGIDTLVLDLGEVAWHAFPEQFCQRLKEALSAALADMSPAGTVLRTRDSVSRTSASMSSPPQTQRDFRARGIRQTPGPAAALRGLPGSREHELAVLKPASSAPPLSSGMELFDGSTTWLSGSSDAELLADPGQQSQLWLTHLAARLLQGGHSQITNGTLQPGTIVVLCRAFAPLLPMGAATAQPDTLRICALHYLQKHPSVPIPQPTSRDAIEVSPHCGPLLSALFEHYENSSPAMAAWLRRLWTHSATRAALRDRLGPTAFRRLETWSNREPIIMPPAATLQIQPTLRPVANAGVTLLWPLLPGLFRQLGLLDGDCFVDRHACRRGARCIDYLACADAQPDDDRLSLSKLLCGLPLLEPLLHCEPDAGSIGIIDNWLATSIRQLPAWSRLGTNAARQMFLQRPGWLQPEPDGTMLHVQPDMYDVLLSDWPWPINIAMLPWLKDPISIHWSVPPHAHSSASSQPLHPAAT